jgi:hypothetical protein
MRAQLPDLVGSFLLRALPPDRPSPALVRVTQIGEMSKQPGGRRMPFKATEDFVVDTVAFSWRARFPLIGPLAMQVVDDFAEDNGGLRVRLLGIPLQTQRGPETAVGQAMRYLAELPWAPQAIAANRQLEWREVDERSVEVATQVGSSRVAVRWEFDDTGDVLRTTGVRPRPVGKTFVPTPWGGDFGDYTSFQGTRIPASGEAWWTLPEGRFVYWRGRITGLELIGDEAPP